MNKSLLDNQSTEVNMRKNKNRQWFESFRQGTESSAFTDKPIAYFCAEYALSPTLPTYAGGLGILAGDMVLEAATQELPMVFVGLRYQEAQYMVLPTSVRFNPPHAGTLTLARDENNFPVLLSLPLAGRTVWYQAWLWQKGSAKVYLLDTDLEQNDLQDRSITHQLYTEDRELRLKQEIILGIGGQRVLRALGYHPSVYHLNEGHSAFLALELIHHEMEHQQVNFKTACIYAKQHILFTNHTIVAAGQELFEKTLVSSVLADYAREIGIDTSEIVALGTIDHLPSQANLFSMTMASFRMSSMATAVSKLHAKVAKNIWPAYPMKPITNGIYLPRWDAAAGDKPIWQLHHENKRKLLAYIEQETGVSWNDDILLFGWARRLVPYKQPLAFLADVERLHALATKPDRPFRIVVSGPTSEEHDGELSREVQRIIKEKLSDIAVFLPHYSLPIAKLMTAGCDVWLNTPMIGSEACGTSGMKAALNGTLALSTRDGWVAEAPVEKSGWVVHDTEDLTETLLTIVEHEIAPLYYKHASTPERSAWHRSMQKARDLITGSFSTTRMLREYIERCYVPLLQKKHTHKFN